MPRAGSPLRGTHCAWGGVLRVRLGLDFFIRGVRVRSFVPRSARALIGGDADTGCSDPRRLQVCPKGVSFRAGDETMGAATLRGCHRRGSTIRLVDRISEVDAVVHLCRGIRLDEAGHQAGRPYRRRYVILLPSSPGKGGHCCVEIPPHGKLDVREGDWRGRRYAGKQRCENNSERTPFGGTLRRPLLGRRSVLSMVGSVRPHDRPLG